MDKSIRGIWETRNKTIDQVHDRIVLLAENMAKKYCNDNKLNDISHNIFATSSMNQIPQIVLHETAGFVMEST